MTMRRLTVVLLGAGISASAQHSTSSTKSHGSAGSSVAHVAPTSATLTPLLPRERVEQLLSRFTFGARPGEVDRVLAMGEQAWLDQQLTPGRVPDGALERRLADYPALRLSPAEALRVFPDRGQIDAVAQGKAPMPTDPLQKTVYEVQLAKLQAEKEARQPDAKPGAKPDAKPDAKPRAEPTEAEKAETKKRDAATAGRVAGLLLALPRGERMAAFEAMPVSDRIAATGNGNLTGDQGNAQRGLLRAQFSPREREAWNAMAAQLNTSGNLGNELQQARVLREVLSERQLEAVMTAFWFNHFNIFLNKDSDQWYTPAYERDVIRPHALGRFEDLLLATAQSPAMMVYLDNWLSIGPDSPANGVNPANPKAKRGNRGLNENYGREVMELHTVGVNGGYTQTDVTALSAILTGWGVSKPQAGDPFSFDPRKHQPGTKTWFGYRISDEGEVTPAGATKPLPWSVQPDRVEESGLPPQEDGLRQGRAALRLLAESPKTAHFIAYLLAQRFVADEPLAGLVDRLTTTYLQSGGDISVILRVLIASPEFNARQYFGTEVKTPEEFLASAFRATATDPQNPGAMVNTLRQMGMEPYRALAPTGYILTADHWMNSVALVDRLNFAFQLTGNKFANQKFEAARVLALGVLHTQPAAFGVQPLSIEGRTTARRARVIPTSAGVSTASATDESSLTATMPGAETALRMLEATVLSTPVSVKTDGLLRRQLAEQSAKQPADASATDSLNVIIALLLGSPEFQLR